MKTLVDTIFLFSLIHSMIAHNGKRFISAKIKLYNTTYYQSEIFSNILIPGSLHYTTVVTFGDSTSDTGNTYRISNRTWPPIPPFNMNGGFADDLLWNQIFTQQLLTNATLQDYSYSSATTDSELVQGTMDRSPNLMSNDSIRHGIKPPGVRQQILQYINTTINKDIDFDRTLYIIWIGINNYHFNRTLKPLETVESIIKCLNMLIYFGVRNLILMNEPPFDRYPAFRNKNTTNSTKYLFMEHNKILFEKVNETYLTLNSRLNIRIYDSHVFISKIMNDYTKYDFENLDNCWDTENNSTVIIQCKDIKKRMFADEYHLTSTMQKLLANDIYSTLTGLNLTSRNRKFTSMKLNLFFVLACEIFLLK